MTSNNHDIAETHDDSADMATWDTIEKMLPGFDLSHLREFFEHTPELYIDMLDQFRRDYSEENVEIMFLLAIENHATAEKMLHKMKGVASNLGAVMLHKSSESLDAEIKRGKYSEEGFENWKASVTQTLGTIDELIKQRPVISDTIRPTSSDPELFALFIELEAILEKDGYVSDELMKKIEGHIRPVQEHLWSTLKEYITAIDYPKARSTLKTLLYT